LSSDELLFLSNVTKGFFQEKDRDETTRDHQNENKIIHIRSIGNKQNHSKSSKETNDPKIKRFSKNKHPLRNQKRSGSRGRFLWRWWLQIGHNTHLYSS
jgi:hypothetical protein